MLEATVQDLILKQMTLMSANPVNWCQDWMAYWQDASERTTLFYDVLRQRGNLSLEQETAPTQPVLDFEFDVLIDGQSLERPVNYSLLRIHPNPNVPTRDDRAPILIIDPRAGMARVSVDLSLRVKLARDWQKVTRFILQSLTACL